jgi:glucan-binding YG repeat protein
MHQYIRVEEDIHRSGTGIYSPELRDDAQGARDTLFTLLSNISGRAGYTALKQLSFEHPVNQYRKWMAQQAYKRAVQDGDLELWTIDQFGQFDKNQTITPATHHQLFDHTVNRLIDLKHWLERGNDSPWRTWKRAEGETEIRTLIAGWLNQNSHGQYTTAQESELANGQRMDIWLHNTSVHSPVPIELKLLDKSWTGPKLCERLKNQLAGDYLREEGAGCGVFLLVSQDIEPTKQWRIDGKLVYLSELAGALKIHWLSIAEKHPKIQELKIIVIDLLERERFSNS